MHGVLLYGLRRHLQGGYSRQIQLISSEFHARFFCVVGTHKIRKLLRNIFYTCVYFSMEVLHVSWQCDNINHISIWSKKWGKLDNTMFHHCSAICVEIDVSTLLKFHKFQK